MKKKLIIAVVVALVAAGGAYKTVLAKPKEKAPEPKVHGTVYVLPKEFLVNLADGRFAVTGPILMMGPPGQVQSQARRRLIRATDDALGALPGQARNPGQRLHGAGSRPPSTRR